MFQPAMWRHEEGQILPLLVMTILATLVLGLAAFQVGKAAILRSGAQTAADAAALAAVRSVKTQLYAMYASSGGVTDLSLVDDGRVRAAADDYAHRNGATVTSLDRRGVDVKVQVRGLGAVKGQAHARARLDMVSAYAGLPSGAGGSIGPEPSEGSDSISDADWSGLAKDIGHPPKCTDSASGNDVVTLGHFLEKHGLMVGENNAFANTVDPVHVSGSWHYRCNDMGAIDVNAAGNEGAILDGLVAPLHKLGFRTIWRAAGHYDHMHIDAGCCDIGVGTAGPVGAGPIEDTTLDVKLIDWDAPYIAFGGFGGLGGGNYSGPPDPDVARAICSVLHRFGASPKVVLAAYETAIVESGVHNLNYGDRDSLGVFQQRPSAGWGTPEQILNPVYAATQFVTRAIRNSSGYMSAGQLAQSVQISAFPDRYDQVAGQATALISRFCP